MKRLRRAVLRCSPQDHMTFEWDESEGEGGFVSVGRHSPHFAKGEAFTQFEWSWLNNTPFPFSRARARWVWVIAVRHGWERAI